VNGITKRVCAAEVGNLEILKWARENGCEWTDKVCTRAMKGQHFEVLQWARANGCPWFKIHFGRFLEEERLRLLRGNWNLSWQVDSTIFFL